MFDEEDDDDELDEAATMNHRLERGKERGKGEGMGHILLLYYSHQSNGITTVSTKGEILRM